jgi:hypothetical protein
MDGLEEQDNELSEERGGRFEQRCRRGWRAGYHEPQDWRTQS